jgi:hypothetical protein
MEDSSQYIETIEINGYYLEEQRCERDRRETFRLHHYNRYERRLGSSRRHPLKIDIEV